MVALIIKTILNLNSLYEITKYTIGSQRLGNCLAISDSPLEILIVTASPTIYIKCVISNPLKNIENSKMLIDHIGLYHNLDHEIISGITLNADASDHLCVFMGIPIGKKD